MSMASYFEGGRSQNGSQLAGGTLVEFKSADGKVLMAPQNVEAEQALLGAIFLNNDAFYRVADIVGPEDFHEPVHREIYDVVAKLIRAGRGATPLTVKTHLPAALTPDLTMAQYLARLAAAAVTVLNAPDYAQEVAALSVRRRLIGLHQGGIHEAFHAEPGQPVAALVERVERDLYALAENGGAAGGFAPFNVALTEAIRMAAAAYERDGGLSGLATGLADLDRLMGGLQKSDLIIIAGRPAMGKTALGTGIAWHVANAWRGHVAPDGARVTDEGGVVGFFSLEMSAEQLATRILAEQAEIASSDIRRGNIHESQFSRLVDVSSRLSAMPLHIDDSGGLTLAQLSQRARRLKRQKGLDLLVVDYLQLLSGDGRRQDNRTNEITAITTGLKALAKELEVPIIALSQLSRQVESREDKRPQLSDLRESGSIEQDADVVLFVYREEYYLGMKEPQEGSEEHLKWQAAMEAATGRADVIIGKQRHGPTGTVQLSFESRFTRFGNLARTEYRPAGGHGGAL